MLPNPEEEFRKKLVLIVAFAAITLYIVVAFSIKRHM